MYRPQQNNNQNPHVKRPPQLNIPSQQNLSVGDIPSLPPSRFQHLNQMPSPQNYQHQQNYPPPPQGGPQRRYLDPSQPQQHPHPYRQNIAFQPPSHQDHHLLPIPQPQAREQYYPEQPQNQHPNPQQMRSFSDSLPRQRQPPPHMPALPQMHQHRGPQLAKINSQAPVPQRSYLPSPSQQTPPSSSGLHEPTQKSPVMRQSINFLRGTRNISSPSLSSDHYERYNDPQQNGEGLKKYHTTTSRHQMSSSGRLIPQKTDINAGPQEAPKKSRSFTSLTKRVASSSSLRSSTDKDKLLSGGSISSKTIVTSSSTKVPYVYPAVLSKVAKAFKERVQLDSKFKNGLEYRDSFTGSEAVDAIARIIRTSDRNLALLLGRSLDAQKFFHDVTYEHRLRDSNNEVYQFSEEVFDVYTNETSGLQRHESVNSDIHEIDNSISPPMTSSPTAPSHSKSNSIGAPVVGVFTLLTECYSPTCSRDNLCYSIVCPRRLEQQARLGSKASSLARSDSRLSLTQKEEQKAFWSLTVPKSVLDSLDKREVKRQECIFELIYSERDFVKDLEYLREFWIRPLSETKIIKENEREHFVNTVFFNINEIWEINSKFAEALTKRQQEKPIVDQIGDLFLEFIPRFEPFVKYGAGQVKGKYEFDRQKRHNPFFVRFIEDTSNRAESRRLDVSSYLSKSTTRPARYPLLLKSVRDHTDPESKDYENLNKAIELLQKMLTRINYETGKASDRLNLFLLKQKLVFRPGEYIDLRLTSEHRKLLYQCVLKKRNYQDREKQGEVQVYLFDHALLFIRIKIVNKREVYRVYQRPIPLPLLFVSLSEESPSIKQIKKSASTGSLTGSSSSLLFKDAQAPGGLNLATNSARFPISFTYLGRSGYDLTLYATPPIQRMLIDKLETQTRKLIEDNDVYTLTPLTSNFFDSNNKINCVVPFDGGRKLLYGTDAGIYVSDVRVSDNGARIVSKPLKIISKINIIQVEILGEYQTLLALSDKKLFYWPSDVLNGGDPAKNAKLGKELMTHVSFYKTGVCAGRMLVCAAKSSSNLIRIFEPIDPVNQKRQKRKFSSETKDVSFNSEPVSINFLKTKLCVGCSKGFEIVSLETNEIKQLLDAADTSLDFVIGKEGLKPLEIDRINSDFLLSYSNFSFFINHSGWRSRSKWIIYWEGVPHAFALWYPYLLAFENGFIEIRHVESGELLRVIIAENIRFLHSSSQEILYAYEDERGYDVVASLDFWDKSKKNRSRGNTLQTATNTSESTLTTAVER
ncbi:hypothetical protein OGAPHI_004891 [Ogataea philodendri]|uniref:Rho1 guanine nucleotide exchange factor 1 n=1 Tax=Ogataea philodendri TaxID=1378263 RepID=A0A9P8P2T7_9ASCO|nr:uncharacterized protein OGAPHI_004891 [Ogataea philodendri]KAH3664177.1 hypothetical protein OGAPHI_004891 [Ogataea philodendri]